MSVKSNIYTEVLADLQQVKEHATKNALAEITSRIEPRVRDFVHKSIFSEGIDDDALAAQDEPIGHDITNETSGEESKECPVTPDADKKINESLGKESLATVYKLVAEIASINSTKNLSENYISTTISKIHNIYEQVKQNKLVLSEGDKTSLLESLEGCNKKLYNMQVMGHNMAKTLNEADVTLKLTGLPDSVLDDPNFLENLGVEITQDDEEGEDTASSDDDMDLSLDSGEGTDGGGEHGDESTGDSEGSLNFDKLDLGGEGGGEKDKKEKKEMDDDTIVELDEAVLRREIKRLKNLREGAPTKIPAPPPVGKPGHSPKVKGDFGGGSDIGEPFLDADTWTGMDDRKSMKYGKPMKEADELPEEDEMVGDHAYAGGSAMEESLKKKLTTLKERYNHAVSRGYKQTAKVVKESYNSTTKELKTLLESRRNRRPPMNESARLNSEQVRQLNEAKQTISNLRKQLGVANTLNAKLGYGLKLLQNTSLSDKQKAGVLASLDEAKNASEAKLVYESIVRNVGEEAGTLTEGHSGRKTNAGSSSTVTRPAITSSSSSSIDAKRWAKLAGLEKLDSA